MKINKRFFAFLRTIFRPITQIFDRLFNKIRKNLRLELMLTFVLCFLAYVIVSQISNELFASKYAYIDYSEGQDAIDREGKVVVEELMNIADSNKTNGDNTSQQADEQKTLQNYLNGEAESNQVKVLIVDLDGKVILKSQNAPEKEIDLYTIISNAMKTRIDQSKYFPSLTYSEGQQEFFSFYPAVYQNMKVYVVVSGVPQATINYVEGKSSLSVIYGLGAFIITFYFLTRRKMRYIEELAKGLLEISKGNLKYRVVEKSEDELGSLANNINEMAAKLEDKIERERKAEKAKNELITNVSHDLRTPLTSIMGYLRLLKDKRYETIEQQENYVDIAYGKAEKLKGLIEDLFEYTKINDENIQLDRQRLAINELLEQLIEELVPVGEENQLRFVVEFPADRIWLNLDSDKIVRVFENLLMNAITYSRKPGEIKVKLLVDEKYVTVAVSNYGEEIPSSEMENLFERFYRVEKSRSSLTGGSGLGLAIAKNIVELHGGKIWAECEGEQIIFFVRFRQDEQENAQSKKSS